LVVAAVREQRGRFTIHDDECLDRHLKGEGWVKIQHAVFGANKDKGSASFKAANRALAVLGLPPFSKTNKISLTELATEVQRRRTLKK
jgi:hypothetical protein